MLLLADHWFPQSSSRHPQSPSIPRHLTHRASPLHSAPLRSAPQDTADPNPLVRALAIRTMSVLRAEKILDYLASPLSRCLRDENPYVRKTAALCVAKVFDLKPELCIEYGFIETLRDLIGDGNPMVSEPKGIMA